MTIPVPNMTLGTTDSEQQGKTSHPDRYIQAPTIHPASILAVVLA